MTSTHGAGSYQEKETPKTAGPSGRISYAMQDAASTFSHPDSYRRLQTERRVLPPYGINRYRGSRAWQALGLSYRRSGISPCPKG